MIKFLSVSALSFVLNFSGYAQDTVRVYAGWNIIGSLGHGPAPEVLLSVPPGIITTEFYGYVPGEGYRSTDTLGKGLGYWVNVGADGLIIFQTSTSGQCGVKRVDYAGVSNGTIQIGIQCWLKENLDVGEMILGSDTASNNGVIEKYCYNNDSVNCAIYGGLYQWNEAMQYVTMEGAQGICPSGWHIPSQAEYQELSSAVGGDGNALKAAGQGGGAGAGTNTSGFSALLSGTRYDLGSFFDLGTTAWFWSSTEGGASGASNVSLYDYDNVVFLYYGSFKFRGLSVRCLED